LPGRFDDTSEGLVAEHKALLPRGRFAIDAVDELSIGAADAYGESFYEQFIF
jgi:hypothetical protein